MATSGSGALALSVASASATLTRRASSSTSSQKTLRSLALELGLALAAYTALFLTLRQAINMMDPTRRDKKASARVSEPPPSSPPAVFAIGRGADPAWIIQWFVLNGQLQCVTRRLF